MSSARVESQPLDLPDTAIVQTTIKRALDKTSLRRVALALELSGEAVLRLAAGQPVHKGTLLVAATNLDNLAALVAV